MRTVIPSARRSTLSDVTRTAASCGCAVPMPTATTASRSSNPTLGTLAFMERSPLSRLCVRISVEDQAEGHPGGALARLRRDQEGHGRPCDFGHPPVAEGVAALEDI